MVEGSSTEEVYVSGQLIVTLSVTVFVMVTVYT